ncbi:MAG: RDD family protein [Nitrospiraceae bacterium]|nr:RDD family protein [Nitrospiraceae bacterium]
MSEDSGKASILLRCIAKAIDFLLIAAAAKLIPQVGYYAGLIYILISDGLFAGSSAGKKIIRLRVVSASDNSVCSFRQSVLRNIPFFAAMLLYIIPLIGLVFTGIIAGIELLLVIGNREGKRLGDEIAGTKVIEA